MADKSSVCILGVMDRLWFHQIILFSERTTTSALLFSKTLITTQSSISSLPKTPLLEEKEEEQKEIFSQDQSPDPISLQDTTGSNNEEVVLEQDKKERPTRKSHIVASRGRRSYSSSPSEKCSKHGRHYSGRARTSVLQKSMSSRSLGELELEEVKGFMDLGFTFKKEHLSPRMIKVIPGLQRLRLLCKINSAKDHQSDHVLPHHDQDDRLRNEEEVKDEELEQQPQEKEEEEDDDDGRVVIRPYLSEAWLIRRPDSPLLNLRMPRASASSDMKKHLRSWARTVATVIQQES